jgi:ATP-dependent protease ClpP protease subunit
MDDAQMKLLEEHKIIILPEQIAHDTYRLIVEATIRCPDDEIDLYCRGEGGYSADTFAIVDIIRRHGKFVGLALGAVVSSHVTIWASCQKRYVYPHGRLGLHSVLSGVSMPEYMDAKTFIQKGSNCLHIDQADAEILAGSSNKDAIFWLDKINNAALGLEWITTAQIIQYDLAWPIAERAHKRPKLSSVDYVVGAAAKLEADDGK